MMRFLRWPKPTFYEDTPRKRAAYLRKQHRECESLPLFSAIVQSEQHDADTEMARRAERWAQNERNIRAARAARWRDVRARLFALDRARRLVIRALWRDCPYPADPSYLGDLMHQIAIGRIDPQRPPWVHPQDNHSRITLNRRRSRRPSARSASARSAAHIRPMPPMSSPGAAISDPAS
jgi:hypothetical protein